MQTEKKNKKQVEASKETVQDRVFTHLNIE